MNTSDWISLSSAVVALISCGAAGGSLWFTYKQWKKIERKIGMVDDWSKASEVLPAWYTSRMMSDDWLFGLLTNDGRTLVIKRITALSDDGKWMDVELSTFDFTPDTGFGGGNHVFAISDDRTKASVQVSSIVAAIELQTS